MTDSLVTRSGRSMGTRSCLFVGVLDYRPNVEGLKWFCGNVWPAIRKSESAATFHIVGRHPIRSVQRLASQPGVHLVGEVPDVRPYLDQTDLVVAPLRVARGIQNKVLEAMAMGKPVIASSQALEGLELTIGTDALKADSPAEWIKHVLDLWRDPLRGQQIGAAGRHYVESHHTWDVCLNPLLKLLDLVATNDAVRKVQSAPLVEGRQG